MRLDPYALRPDAYQALRALNRHLSQSPLEHSLRCLVEIRVSQLNGCGFCLAMHADLGRGAGVAQSKLDTVAGWRDDVTFNDRERAGLELAEAVTTLQGNRVSDDVWDRATSAFDDVELADLLYLIGLMNLYNRLNIAAEFPAQSWREHGLAGLGQKQTSAP